MGLRVVASPTPDNQRVAALDEHVVLASSPDEWLRALCDALSAKEPAGRSIPPEHSYEERWAAWAGAWERAYVRRTRLSA